MTILNNCHIKIVTLYMIFCSVSTLMFSSSLSNFYPRPKRGLTMRVNLFWTLAMDSPFCILKSTYFWIKACFLALFTSFIPSCVTSRTSHISFALLHWENLKNSSVLKDEVMIFLALQSYWALLLSSSVHSIQGLSTCLFSTIHLGVYGPLTIASQILYL